MTDITGFQSFYVLAAKGIQGYIFKTDKLKPMVGASELIENLTAGFLSQVLRKLNIPEDGYRIISRAAGNARILFKDPNSARALAKVLPILIGRYAPGLDMVQALVELRGNLFEAMSRAEQILRERRNYLRPTLPPAGPLVRRNPRSGLPAEETVNVKGIKEPVSREVSRKYTASDKAVMHLIKKVSPETPSPDYECWPQDFDEIAKGDNSYLGIIHADANGMGQIIMRMAENLANSPERQLKVYEAFTRGVAAASEGAVKKALESVLVDYPQGPVDVKFPVRPIVCAGDDLTLAIAAPYAFRFVRDYLVNFEELTRAELSGLSIPGLEKLTACAGVVFVKKSFPFAQAYNLAETLCKFAKNSVDRQASAVAFWRQTTSSGRDYEDILKQELTVNAMVLTMNPYRISAPGTPLLDDLQDLIKALSGLPRGSLREVVSCSYSGYQPAQRAFERFCQVQETQDSRKKGLENFKAVLTRITGNQQEPLWQGDEPRRTPLYDALELQTLKSII